MEGDTIGAIDKRQEKEPWGGVQGQGGVGGDQGRQDAGRAVWTIPRASEPDSCLEAAVERKRRASVRLGEEQRVGAERQRHAGGDWATGAGYATVPWDVARATFLSRPRAGQIGRHHKAILKTNDNCFATRIKSMDRANGFGYPEHQ